MGALDSDASPGTNQLKRTGIAGIAIGAAVLLVCELPVILALVGLAGLNAGATMFRPTPIVEAGAVAVTIAGATVLLVILVRRMHSKRKRK